MKGYSGSVINVFLKSWRKSTLDQYVTYAKLWFRFAGQGLTPSVRNLVEFLYHLHSKGYNHKQLCQARSAVSALSSTDDVGKHPDVKRFLKGLFEKKPQFPVYSCVWNVKTLLDYLRSIPHQDMLSLEMLSKKLAILIGILAGGQRSQTIHTIKSTDIVVANDKCIIPIYDVIKQSKQGKHMRPLEFRVFTTDQKLCVVQNLVTYLQKTRGHRKSPELFLSYQRPYHPVTKDTVARWINDIMQKAGINMNHYVTHSCRAAASSALKKRVPLKKVLNACGWASERTFAVHYQKDIEDDLTVAEALLG